MTAFYNENAAYPAAWLKNLSRGGLIAPGYVEECSIAEVHPLDLYGYTQAHFFAGLGAWSYALRLAGWPDDRPVWTGSCPCQPWSIAGKGKGADDERHLWPEWFRLIRECRPPVIFGEQVAGPDGRTWLDVVSSDLEAEGYAVGAADLCAAGVGAPHLRQRLFFVAYAERDIAERRRFDLEGASEEGGGGGARQQRVRTEPVDGGADGGMADSALERRRRKWLPQGQAGKQDSPVVGSGGNRGLADNQSLGRRQGRSNRRRDEDRKGSQRGQARQRLDDSGFTRGLGDSDHPGLPLGPKSADRRGAVRQKGTAARPAGPWSDVRWLLCEDGKYRPTQPGLHPLAHGSTARVGRIRAYGNAIVAPLAAAFIQAVMDILPESL